MLSGVEMGGSWGMGACGPGSQLSAEAESSVCHAHPFPLPCPRHVAGHPQEREPPGTMETSLETEGGLGGAHGVNDFSNIS